MIRIAIPTFPAQLTEPETGAPPRWLRAALAATPVQIASGDADVSLAAGAAFALLDNLVRRQECWAGVWRQRLALSAATASARRMGRSEDEAALRDAVYFAADASCVGPAGQLFVAWRRVTQQPAGALLKAESLAALLPAFGHSETAGEAVAEALLPLPAEGGLAAALEAAFQIAAQHHLGRDFGALLADAILAQRLAWPQAVPLLAARLPFPRRTAVAFGGEGASALRRDLLAAYAKAALDAIDLSAALGRRAARLLAIAPKLRAGGAHAVIGLLLSEDALVASRGERRTGMSDRALRRLFDRLASLNAVRELSGRATFRIYGL